jgi:hypothetical protein
MGWRDEEEGWDDQGKKEGGLPRVKKSGGFGFRQVGRVRLRILQSALNTGDKVAGASAGAGAGEETYIAKPKHARDLRSTGNAMDRSPSRNNNVSSSSFIVNPFNPPTSS